MNYTNYTTVPEPSNMGSFFSIEQERILAILVTCSSTLSFIGCVIVLVSYLMFHQYQHFHMRLILYLVIADLTTSVVAVIGTHSRLQIDKLNAFCNITASGLQFSMLGSIFWTGCIAHTLDQVVRQRNFSIENYEVLYHIICWGLPFGTVIYLWMTQRFGDAGLWCWIQGEQHGMFRYLFFYGPVFIIFIYNIGIYCLVSWKLNRENKRILRVMDEKTKEHTIQTTFRWFMVAFFICWMPATINRIQNSIAPNNPIFWLYCLHAAFTPLQGFFDAAIYGFNDELRRHYHALLLGCCSCCKPRTKLSIQESDQWKRYYEDAMREYEETD